MTLTRRTFTRTVAAMAALPLLARAEDSKPIEWVIGYAAGGGSDVLARTVAEPMGKALGRSIFVNNKPGAATNIAADYVAKSRDIGNIMLSADFATLAANPALFSKLPYDAEADFAPVGLMARFPLLLVVAPDVPARNYKELAAWVRSKKDGVSFGSAGNGSPHHLAGEMFRERSGLTLQHVPYRGAAPAMQDLLGSQIPCGVIDSASVLQYLSAGKLRAVGVFSPKRLAVLPDVPTLAEQGPGGFEAFAWQGLVVPKATPAPMVTALNKALLAALDNTYVKARFQTLALEALPGTPAQMASYARSERERWGQLIRARGIKLD